MNRLSLDDYALGKLIGEGNFSVIYEATNVHKERMAVKILDNEKVKRMKRESDVLMEIHSLRKLSHGKHVIKLIDSFVSQNRNSTVVVTELCLCDLWSLAARWGEPENRARVFLAQVVCGLEHMHSLDIAHRDLKAENVFVALDGYTVKLGDFGSSRDMSDPKLKFSVNSNRRTVYQHYVGTPNFMAPEAINNWANDKTSDLWSLGGLIFQLLSGIPPFAAASEYLVFQRALATDIVFPLGTTEEASDLIRGLLNPDRFVRYGLPVVKQHNFFHLDSHQWQDINSDSLPLPEYTDVELKVKQVAQAATWHPDERAWNDPDWSEAGFTSEECNDPKLDLLKQKVLQIRQWERAARPLNR